MGFRYTYPFETSIRAGIKKLRGLNAQKVYGGFKSMMSSTVELEENAQATAFRVINASRAAHALGDSNPGTISANLKNRMRRTDNGNLAVDLNPLEALAFRYASSNAPGKTGASAFSGLDPKLIKKDITAAGAAVAPVVAGAAVGTAIIGATNAAAGAYNALRDD